MVITDNNTQTLYAKTRLVFLAYIYYDLQTYDNENVI